MAVVGRLRNAWNSLTRTKSVNLSEYDTRLRRCLSTLDLTVIGIGGICGVGIYILTGTIIRDKTGPAGFIAFAIAGLVALLNAMCYAELGCRIPKAGSAYTFTYVTAGELPAFIIGWAVILEYAVGAASVARGWSGALDALTGGAIRNGTLTVIGGFGNSSMFVSEYPDLVAGGVVVLLALVLISGAKLSSHFNLVTTSINMLVLLVMIITLFIYADPDLIAPADHGGFLPYSFDGVIAGAATLFYSFIGFDTVVTSVEEASNPAKSIPLALIITILFVTALKVICAVALVLYVPWWTIDRNSGFVRAFQSRGLVWAGWLTGVGSLVGISAVLLITLFGAPRIVYAMATDGLLFRCLGYVWPRTQVPLAAICFLTPIAALGATFFDIATLADFISIGTLLAYTMVACSVLNTRYKVPTYLASMDTGDNDSSKDDETVPPSEFKYLHRNEEGRLRQTFRSLPLLSGLEPGTACKAALYGYVLFAFSFAATLLIGLPKVVNVSWWAITLLVLFGILALVCVFILAVHVPDQSFQSFRVPLVPYLPCACIVLNFCLIVKLPATTWARFGVWMAIGLSIYFAYGVWASSERKKGIEEEPIVGNKNGKSYQ